MSPLGLVEATLIDRAGRAETTAGAVLAGIRDRIGSPKVPTLAAAVLSLQMLSLVGMGLLVPGGPNGIYAGYLVLPAIYAVVFLLIYLWSERDAAPAGLVLCTVYATAPVAELLELNRLVRAERSSPADLSGKELAVAVAGFVIWLGCRLVFFALGVRATRADARRQGLIAALTRAGAPPPPPPRPLALQRGRPEEESPSVWNVLFLGFAVLALAMAASAWGHPATHDPLVALARALQLGTPILLLAVAIACRVFERDHASHTSHRFDSAVGLLALWLALASAVKAISLGLLLAKLRSIGLRDEDASVSFMNQFAAFASYGSAAIACFLLWRRLASARHLAPRDGPSQPKARRTWGTAPLTWTGLAAGALVAQQLLVLAFAGRADGIGSFGAQRGDAGLVPAAQAVLSTLTLIFATTGAVLALDPSLRRKAPWSGVATAGFVAFVGLFVLRAVQPAAAAPLLSLASDLVSAGLLLILATVLPAALEDAETPRPASSISPATGGAGGDGPPGRLLASAVARAFAFLRNLTNDVDGRGRTAFSVFAGLALLDTLYRLAKVKALDASVFWPTEAIDPFGVLLLVAAEIGAAFFILRYVGAGLWHLISDNPALETHWTWTLRIARNLWGALATWRALVLFWDLHGVAGLTFLHGPFVIAWILDVSKALLSWRWGRAWARAAESLQFMAPEIPDEPAT